MKIDFIINVDQLCVINASWIYITGITEPTREAKVVVSVLKGLAVKFQRKAIAKAEAKKPFKIALDYYEAHYLERFLLQVRLLDSYHNNMLRHLIFQLNQKLC